MEAKNTERYPKRAYVTLLLGEVGRLQEVTRGPGSGGAGDGENVQNCSDPRGVMDGAVLPDKVRIADGVVSEQLDGEAVLLHLGSGTYYTLNETGSRIWKLLEELGDPRQALETMCAEYEADRETVAADIHELITDLGARGLLSVG